MKEKETIQELQRKLNVVIKALCDIESYDGGILQPDASKSCALREIAREALKEIKE